MTHKLSFILATCAGLSWLGGLPLAADNSPAVGSVPTQHSAADLIDAAGKNDVDALQRLLSHGADVNAKASNGETALMEAAVKGSLRAAQFLVSHGADVHAREASGDDALMLAVDWGHSDVGELLLIKGADVNAKDDTGFTSLRGAALKDSLDLARLLLDHHADANLPDIIGKTPLMQAAEKGSLAMVKLLLDSGADISALDASGSTAIDIARANDHSDVVQYLEQASEVNKALIELMKHLREKNIYSGPCYGFVNEKAGTAGVYVFAVRELRGSGCPGDPNTSPVLDYFRVRSPNGQIEWLDRASDKWKPYSAFLKQR